MAPGRKLGQSCWTCRLRRKRCDAAKPICGNCGALDIPCHSGRTRPSWMDGGAGRKHMSDTIKRRIKENALLRREKRQLAGREDNLPTLLDDVAISATNSASAPSRSSESDNGFQSELPLPSHESPITAPSSISSSSCRWSGVPLQAPAKAELAWVMIYLDYVFPFLFPFYRPSLLETGRQWLLGMLCENEVSFHTAASLSSYFFSLVPQSEGREMHPRCKAVVWQKLIGQMDVAVQTIHNNVAVMSQGTHEQVSSLTDKARLFEEIAQLLIVQVTVHRDVEWEIHLAPAVALFDEMFTVHGLKASSGELPTPSLAVLLSAMPSLQRPAPSPEHKPVPHTPDQSALAFFVSLLLFIDIVASTSLGKAPDLHKYHSSLLSAQSEEECRIRLESIVGCQNWPLLAIGEISALCAWKREAKHSGTFSVLDLVNRAGPISQALDSGLCNLDNNPPRAAVNGNRTTRRLEGYYSRHDRSIDHTSIANVTRIWAYTAKLYLSVTLSGWQPKSAEVQQSVAKVLSLLQTIDSPAQLRSLSWPICVAGCLALPEQEDEFRRVADEVGELAEFGTIEKTVRIMEAAWRSRDMVDGDGWDLASSLNILGSSALLI